MSLYIREPEIDALAEEVRRLTGASSKAEAVRQALQAQVAAARKARPFSERLLHAQSLADAVGPVDPEFDLKRFSDAMWDDA